jgi:hypothetical protein
LTLNGVTRKRAKAQISGDRHASQIDARQKKLCDHAKAANITIHTVQVNTGSTRPPACCRIARAAPTSSIW